MIGAQVYYRNRGLAHFIEEVVNRGEVQMNDYLLTFIRVSTLSRSQDREFKTIKASTEQEAVEQARDYWQHVEGDIESPQLFLLQPVNVLIGL